MPKLIDHDRRREEIAEATWRVIHAEGISGISIRTVAAEAGISTGSIRHVFPSKTELLVHATELVGQRAWDRTSAILTSPNRARSFSPSSRSSFPSTPNDAWRWRSPSRSSPRRREMLGSERFWMRATRSFGRCADVWLFGCAGLGSRRRTSISRRRRRRCTGWWTASPSTCSSTPTPPSNGRPCE